VAPAFAGRVWFVDLAGLPDPNLIPFAVGNALQLAPVSGSDPLRPVVDLLGDAPCLLVLDNFEQLLRDPGSGGKNGHPAGSGGGAAYVRLLLERVPRLTCLVTSRQPLHLGGEQEFPLPPLPVPEGSASPEHLLECGSVALYVDRAQAAKPDFAVTAQNAAAVAALCRKLEGMPLAVEMAAAWAKTLPPARMLERLEHQLDLLISRRRDLPPRQQRLRATIQWSYDLLSPELQTWFARLGIFRGGWTLEAAEAVCSGVEGDALLVLSELQEHSLIVAEEEGARYRMLEPLREFAREQLASEEHAALARRHTEFFHGFLKQELAHAEVRLADEQAALERLEQEHDNLRTALAWSQSAALAGNPSALALGLALGGDLGLFWSLRGYLREAREQLERLLAIDSQVRSNEAAGAGSPGEARCLARSRLLARAGLVAGDQGDYPAMRAHFQESLYLRRQFGGPKEIAYSLAYLGGAAREEGDLEAARSYFEEALAINREQGAGGEPGCALALGNLGGVAFCRGQLDAARRFYEESLALYRRLGDKRGSAWVLHGLAMLARRTDDLQAGRMLEAESLKLRHGLSSPQGVAECLLGFAELAPAEGAPARAARLLGAAAALCEAIGYRLPAHERQVHDQAVAAVRAARRDGPFEAAWREGQALTLEQAVAETLQP
jgi:predicted ATPase